jgi:predicted HicB family RNase H-like nuclease
MIFCEDYFEMCAKNGREPQKPAGDKLMLRIPPEIHSAALVATQSAGMSLNQ